MGGTSADFSVIAEGEPRTVRERAIGGQPLRLTSLDIETISAGGGSIAWVDRAGALKVGPDSAGAVPGPACYGQGGSQPTVSDAAVLLGLLDPERYLGGRIKLDADLAAAAVREGVARPLGLALEEAAAGIIAIANVQMTQAIRTISVERGLDVRRFSLLAFGGAGPLLAPYLAAGLEMAEVLVPRHPGVFCAEGLLMSDIRHSLQLVHRRPLASIDAGELAAKAMALRRSSRRSLPPMASSPRPGAIGSPAICAISASSTSSSWSCRCPAKRNGGKARPSPRASIRRIAPPMVMGNPRRRSSWSICA